ncbi:tetratricopeptide repeat protein [Acanthopleuribacter pedis]|uniref:Tetratricopeptide repeat protein n=1 Tax=Acanthopleuribacter pedis TaxID=442870 RepID=A0A8J7QHV1_9BACT|nr:hypothetical protein [Acanthopleuribacter pedis]MBO1320861.1 hypothetical protein [Acanthopleuribacter pedis]
MSTTPKRPSYLLLCIFSFLLNALLFPQQNPQPAKPRLPTIDYLHLPPELAPTLQEAAKNRRYLDIARALAEEARKLEDPSLIRAFTCFVIDFHSKQLTWSLFFTKNLLPGESIYSMRLNTDTIVPNSGEQPVEEELGRLLQRARAKYPKNLHLEFAAAYYHHQGRRFLLKPPFTFTPEQTYAIYENAYEQKIYTPNSLVFTALVRGERKQKTDTIDELLRRAYHLNPNNPKVLEALLNHLLHQKEFKQALSIANQLFTNAATPEQKIAGYSGAARSFFYLENYESTLTAVENGLKLAPNHTLLWAIGLDTLRKQKRWDDYEKLVRGVLDRQPESPAPFIDYLDYLRLRGVTPRDDSFVAAYAEEKGGSDMARITRHTNAGNFHLTLFADGPAALKQFKKAKKLSKKLKNPPPDMTRVIDGFIEKAKNTNTLRKAPRSKE